MKMRLDKYVLPLIAACVISESAALAQERFGESIEFESTSHNFGDITSDAGPQVHTFIFKNVSDKPVALFSVNTTCGCTSVKWTKEPIQAGKTGKITATYTNDEGPYPFDKTLMAYFSGIQKPVILRLSGTVHEKKKSLEEIYTIKSVGGLAFSSTELKCGNIAQGTSHTETVMVANLGNKSITVGFRDVDGALKLKMSQNPIPARSTATLEYTVSGDRSRWGSNILYFAPEVDGKVGEKIGVNAFFKENFSAMTKEQTQAGPQPSFKTSTYSFGKVKAGTKIDISYNFTNNGKSSFKCYKVDTEGNISNISVPEVNAGAKGTVKMTLDTSTLPKGDNLLRIILTTNSPSRPVINLYITGIIE